MANLKITIIGLGRTGVSLGMALKRESVNFEIVGHDRESERNNLAKRLNAVDRTDWNLYNAIENADMVVLAVPYIALPEILGQIGQDLKPGCLVMALVSAMEAAQNLARQHLAPGVHFMTGHPILPGVGGILNERADLFVDAIFCLSPEAETDPEAVEVVNNLVERLGATPLYLDAVEHDGLTAGVEHLPNLLAGALMRLTANSPSWREARKLAGRPFAHATELPNGAEMIGGALQANRENVLRWLQALRAELAEWEESLRQGDGEAIIPLLTEAAGSRERWETDAILKEWDREEAQETPKDPGLFRQMFMGNMFSGRRKLPEDK